MKQLFKPKKTQRIQKLNIENRFQALHFDLIINDNNNKLQIKKNYARGQRLSVQKHRDKNQNNN